MIGKKFGALVALALLAAACGKRALSYPRAPIVLISIDTLRADHLPAYGDTGVQTPAIDGLRRDAILFENAYSHVPLTLPSHTTMFTGLLPPQAGVRDNVGYILAETHPTLADTLKKASYQTGASVSSVVLASASGVGRGFDEYDDDIEVRSEGASLAQVQRSGFQTEKIAESWIGSHGSGLFFYFLHLYEPHSPYDPIEPYRTIYKDRPYDGEIATVDQIVGNFVSFLKERKIYDRALVILLSDHGEGLGQHGEDEHGTLLYREQLHVPLLIKLPGQKGAGSSVREPVGLFDIFPTILSTVGLKAPAGLPGRALPLAAGGGPGIGVRNIYSETLYPRYHFGWSDLAALINDRYQYIHAPRPELYDIVEDRTETRDLAPGLPSAFRTLRLALSQMNRPRQAPGASDPEQLKKLASLGYIGSAAPAETAQNLPDPKDHIEELAELKQAFKHYHDREYEKAVEAVRRLLKKNPQMSDAWGALANSFHKLGRNEDAIAALKEQDRLQPGSGITLASFANEYLELENLEKARLYAERSIAVNGPPQAHEALAAVLLAQKELDGAEREARLAMGNHRGRKKPLVILAQVAKARGDLAGALAQLDALHSSSEEEEREMSNVSYLRGDILARMGRNREAEEAFQREIRLFPNNVGARSALAFLYASEGRSDEARKTLLEMVRVSPNPRSFMAASKSFGIMGDAGESRRFAQMARQSARAPVGRVR
jgi:arylsulfatase A-like enzyme/tetratricopeptide (TPR) repeat protein